MKFLIIILSIMIFTKTLSYGIYEIKWKNKIGGISIIIVAIISLILSNVMVYIKGI